MFLWALNALLSLTLQVFVRTLSLHMSQWVPCETMGSFGKNTVLLIIHRCLDIASGHDSCGNRGHASSRLQLNLHRWIGAFPHRPCGRMILCVMRPGPQYQTRDRYYLTDRVLLSTKLLSSTKCKISPEQPTFWAY